MYEKNLPKSSPTFCLKTEKIIMSLNFVTQKLKTQKLEEEIIAEERNRDKNVSHILKKFLMKL